MWGKNPEVVGNGLSGGRNVFFTNSTAQHSTKQHSATQHSIAQRMRCNQVKKPRYWPCRAECNSFGRNIVGCPLGMFGALWATHHNCFNQLKNPGMLTLSKKCNAPCVGGLAFYQGRQEYSGCCNYLILLCIDTRQENALNGYKQIGCPSTVWETCIA